VQVDDLFEVEKQTGDAGPAMVLRVHVQPGAGRSAVVGRHGTALKVRVAAPPVGGRANDACAEVLAEALGLTPAQVELVGGRTSRSKTVRISGVDAEEFARRLEQAVGEGPPGTGPDPSRTGRR
jgi:uncharacterized protein (TIGR00251 family)